jgi:hypothetical protein
MWRPAVRDRPPRATLTHTVRSESDLIGLRRGLSFWKFGRRQQIALLLPELESTKNSQYEQSLNRLVRECGCGWGAAFALVTLGTVLAIRLVQSPGVSFSYLLVSLLLALALMLPAAIAGKFLGLLRAHRRFARTCLELQNAIHHVHV